MCAIVSPGAVLPALGYVMVFKTFSDSVVVHTKGKVGITALGNKAYSINQCVKKP